MLRRMRTRRACNRRHNRIHAVGVNYLHRARSPGATFREVEQFEPKRLLTLPAAPLIGLDQFGFGAVSGEISLPGETDVFQYQAPSDGFIQIDQFADGSSLDSLLEIQDENCEFITSNDDGPFGLDSQVILPVSSGDTLHFVAGAFSSSTGAYSLVVGPLADDQGDTIFDSGFLSLESEGSGFTTGRFEQPSDVDVFQLISPLTGTLTITQEATDELVDSLLKVRDQSGNIIAVNDDFAFPALDSQVTISVDAGEVLYIEATELSGSIGTYQLTVSGDFGDDDSNATPLQLVDDAAFIFGEAQTFGDLDVFEFLAPGDGTATFNLLDDDGEFDPFLTVRNEFGQIVALNDDFDGFSFDSRVDVPVDAGDLLFVEASEAFGFPGFYLLDAFFNSAPAPLITTIDGDTVVVNDAISDEFEVDLFRLDITSSGLLTIDLNAADESLDPTLRLLDSEGFELLANDDFGESANSHIEFPVFAGEQFLVEAGGFFDSAGPYELRVGLNSTAPDDFPNTVEDAAPLMLDQTGNAAVTGNIEAAFDVDVFSVAILQDGRLTVGQTGVNGILDPFLFVLDENGFERSFNDDFGGTLNSQLDIFVEAGETVFIEAGGFSDSTGEYDLHLTLTDDTAGIPGDDFPDFVTNATPLPLDGDGNATVNGVIERAFDVDVVSVTATQTGVLTIQQDSRDGLLDPFLSILDGQGSVVAQNDDSGFSLNSEIALPVTAGDTIFIQSGAFFDSIGGYTLTIQSGDPVADDFGNNDGAAQSLTLNLDDTVQQLGDIEVFGDRDVFSVQFPADGTVSIAVTGADEFILDPLVRIRNSAGEQVAFDDDGGVGLNSLARVGVSAGDILFIDVGTFADASTGSYSLDIALDQGVVIADDFVNTIADATAGSPQNLTVTSAGSVIQPGSIELPGDVDVFRVDIDAGVAADSALQIRQSASGVSAFGLTLDTLLRVFNDAGEEIAFNDDDGLSLNSEVTVQVSGGNTVFVQAGAFGQSSGGYNLDLSLIVDDFSDTVEQAGSNPQLLSTLSGSIERSGDVDVFKLDPSLSGRVEIRQRGVGADPADSFLQIFRRTGNDGPLEFVTLNDDSDGTLDSQVLIDVKADETFYVFASAFGLTTGDYELEVTSLVADDVGDTFASGTLLDVAGVDVVTRQAEINFAGDVDIFEFVSDQDGSATIQVASGGSGFDGSVSVFRMEDSSLVRIASEEADGSGNDLLDAFDLTADTRYFVSIDGLGTIGTYDLTVTLSDQPLAVDGKIPEEVFESVDERLRELFASGASFDELIDGAVAEFLAAMGGQVGDDEFFVFVADPVDFVLADSQSRRVGFTADQGRVNEVQGARLSQNAPVEVLILPTTDRQFPVQLQGVGANFQVGGRIVTQAGAINGSLMTSTGQTATGAGTLSKDDGNVALVFDFTEQQQNTFPQNVAETDSANRALAAATDADTTQFRLKPGDQVAVAAESARAMQDLRDAYDDRVPEEDEENPILPDWLQHILDLMDSAADSDSDDDSGVNGADVFWSVFGGGVMNHLWELGEGIIEHAVESESGSESEPTDEAGNDSTGPKPQADTQPAPQNDSTETPQDTEPAGDNSSAANDSRAIPSKDDSSDPWAQEESSQRLTAGRQNPWKQNAPL